MQHNKESWTACYKAADRALCERWKYKSIPVIYDVDNLIDIFDTDKRQDWAKDLQHTSDPFTLKQN